MTTLQEAPDAPGCERIKGFYNVGPVQRAAVESFVAALAQQGEQRCTYCDGTGDVHGIDGEWRGTCPCAAAPAPQPNIQKYPEKDNRLSDDEICAIAQQHDTRTLCSLGK